MTPTERAVLVEAVAERLAVELRATEAPEDQQEMLFAYIRANVVDTVAAIEAAGFTVIKGPVTEERCHPHPTGTLYGPSCDRCGATIRSSGPRVRQCGPWVPAEGEVEG